MCFIRASCAAIKAVKAFCVVEDSAGGTLFCGRSGSIRCGVSSETGGGEAVGASSAGKTDFRKCNRPKGSIAKKPPKFQNFSGKITKRALFSIALIDNLSYNRICVNIVEQYTLFAIARQIDEN